MLSKKAVAVILGGGAGKRLFPLTATRSKPAVPIAGKYRLVDIPISNCINSDINRMFVITQYNSASLNKHIKNTYQFSAFSSGFVDILAAEQTPDSELWFQGTADAVRQSLKHIANNDFEYVLILSGDQLYQMDFREMLQNHIDEGVDISIATIPVTGKEATEFGILKSDAKNYITSFIEKPAADILPQWTSETGDEMKNQGRHYLASMGIYIFNRELLFELLKETKKEATDFGKEIIPHSIKDHKVLSYQYEGYWTDIGNISSFYEANLALTAEIPLFNLFDNTKSIYSRPRMLPPMKIAGTHIDSSILAEGSFIHASLIKNSVIGIRTRMGKNTQVISSYIMGSDYYETLPEMAASLSKGIPKLGIGENCIIENAILDKDCRIGDNVEIHGGPHLPDSDNPLYTVKDGIVVVKKGAILNDGFKLG